MVFRLKPLLYLLFYHNVSIPSSGTHKNDLNLKTIYNRLKVIIFLKA